MEDYSKLKKDDLIAALNERDGEIIELNTTLDQALNRLTQSEGAKKTGVKVTHIDAGEYGEYTFRGNGIKRLGTFYSAEDLKNKPEVVVALFESGSETVKKTK